MSTTLKVGQLSELTIAAQRAAIAAVSEKKDKFLPEVAQELVDDYSQLNPFFDEALDRYLDSRRLLEAVTSVTVALVDQPFVVADHFKVDVSEKAIVKISYLGDNFKEWFLGQTIQCHNGYSVNISRLKRVSVDGPIVAELGQNYETDLATVFHFMSQQPKGEKGVLLINRYANIFYINGRAVYVFWLGGGWRVHALPVVHPRPWSVGYQVFSRIS